jgi:hypothetical protein
VTAETPDAPQEPPPPPDIPQEPAWLRRLALVCVFCGVVVAAFFVGRYTALPPVSNTPPVDPCAEVHKAYKDIDARADWGSSGKLRTLLHLVVDHPECYSAETVAISKSTLDQLA